MKQIVFGAMYIIGLYVLTLLLRPVYIGFLIQNFSERKYFDDLSLGGQRFQYLMLFGYCVISFYWIRRTLERNYKLISQWILSWTIDFLILPLSVLIIILYHNRDPLPVERTLSSVENFFLIWFLLAIKHIFFHIVKGNLSFGTRIKKKSSDLN